MKTETFGTTIAVTRRQLEGAAYHVKWTRGDNPPEALILQGDDYSRAFCERVAGGEAPINVLYALARSRAMSKAGKAGGGLAWQGLTKDQRSARAREAAKARWAAAKAV